MTVDVLAFAAHPDDVEMGMGGTMLKLKAMGHTLGIIDLTRGELSSNGTPESRAEETDTASEIMQLDIRENLDLGDGYFEENRENTGLLMDLIRKYRPKVIFAPYFTDRHPDHERCARMVKAANFYAGLSEIKTTFERHRAKSIYHYMTSTEFTPTVLVDISEFMDAKMELYAAYKSQFYSNGEDRITTHISRPEFTEFMRARCRFYGEKAKVLYAEPFYVDGFAIYDDMPELDWNQ